MVTRLFTICVVKFQHSSILIDLSVLIFLKTLGLKLNVRR